MDILYLVDRLENLITGSQRMPLTNRVLIKEQEVLNIIDEMRLSVPDEIKQARRVNQEKERILAQAREEATRIIAAAREEAERLVNRDQLVQKAEQQAARIIRETEEKAAQIQQGADSFVSETLRNLEEHLSAIETQISNTILSIRKGIETLSQGALVEKEAAAEERHVETRPAPMPPLTDEDYADIEELTARTNEQQRSSGRRERPRW
jgi:vacuolar-type H+-ATPase subunit H